MSKLYIYIISLLMITNNYYLDVIINVHLNYKNVLFIYIFIYGNECFINHSSYSLLILI